MPKSDAMRLIEAAEAAMPGEQPPIVLLWEDYRALVAERDEARQCARIGFKWAGGEHLSESPKGLVHELEDTLDVEDYTQFPDWLTGGRGY